MNESLLARRYAKALLAYAEELGEADLLYPVMRHLGRTLRHASRESEVVDNPTLSEELRGRFVEALAGVEPVPESLRRFVRLVFDHNREYLFGPMALAYLQLYRQSRGIVVAEVRCAHPLSEEAKGKIERLIAAHKQGKVELEVKVESRLIGGFVVTVDGKRLDASVAGELERIRQHLSERNRSIV